LPLDGVVTALTPSNHLHYEFGNFWLKNHDAHIHIVGAGLKNLAFCY